MVKTIISERKNTSQHIVGGNNELVVTETGSIGVDNFSENPYAIFDDAGWSGNRIKIDGLVHGVYDLNNTYGAAIYSLSNQIQIEVGRTGEVSGTYGIVALGDNPDIVNRGEIIGLEHSAIDLGDGTGASGGKVQNFGRILAGSGVIVETDGAIITNEEEGEITSWGTCVGVIGATTGTTLVNHGTIYAYYNGSAFSGGTGTDKIVNDGTIIGNIYLTWGDDVVDNRGGKIDGWIQGFRGNDTLITDNAKDVLQEFSGADMGDFDAVRSTVSYKLTEYVEELVLLGSKDINGTGTNDAATNNYLYGNTGDNVLKGLGGYNELFGRGGRDVLVGGADTDLFGIGQRYGHDTVIGFQDGVDQIDIYKLGPENFDELESHIEDHGRDTWIEFGKAVLILKDVDRQLLDATDFIYNY